jgi:ammonia channel protein AmtB
MMILGTFITVIGMSMLNACGSGSHNINSVSGRFAAESAFLNTFLAGSFSSFISILFKRYIVRGDHLKTQRYDVRSLCNGFLAGVAAVSAGSGTMKPWGALVTGSIEAFLYMTLCLISKKSKFDDPMENFQIYTSAGFWGMIASAFFIPNKGVLWGGKESGSFIGI